MTKIADLLDPAKVAALSQVQTVPEPVPEPTWPRLLTAADGVVIDPASEALIDANCVGCGCPILLDPVLPEGVDPNTPRIPICAEDAEAYALWVAAEHQRDIEIVRRNNDTKEERVDFKTMRDEDLGKAARKSMQQAEADRIKAERPKVEAKRRAQDKKNRADREVEREQLMRVLPGFTIEGKVVPDLDLSQPSSLNEVPDKFVRSPYNKALYALGMPLLAPTDTYEFLAQVHEVLADACGAEPVKVTKKQRKAAQAVVSLLADEPVKVQRKAIKRELGVDKEVADAILASL